MVPLYRSLMLFILLKCIFPEMDGFLSRASGSTIDWENLCHSEIEISAGVGEDVILPVNSLQTGAFSWRYDNGHYFWKIAETEPGGTIWGIEEPFTGRLSSTENGSLIITNVTTEDPRTYFEWPQKLWPNCIQAYNLRIYNNFPQKDPIVRRIDSVPLEYFCVPVIEIIVGEGGEVILPVLKGKTFDWRFDNGYQYRIFAKTKPDGTIWDIKEPFTGRLSSTENGSLIITNVTMKDPRTYVEWSEWPDCMQKYFVRVYKPVEAEDILIHHNVTGMGTCNITLTCAVAQPHVNVSWDETNQIGTEAEGDTLHIYNVDSTVTYSCTAQNPISRASRSINPWDLCYKGAEPEGPRPATVAPFSDNALEENQIMKDQGVPHPDLGKI
ncbi:hypothetical protein XENTR_v10022582 [Xenopus tropicalis]|uniref:Uncharacterized protein LOC100498477 n=1 Tax=Xenopus tropicalis TaxID=8364 RepID=A0A8J0QNC2_XENTR|nr:uncharacterized protein LOC100498477 [Xenopus tropicalis]KAE8588502.1 hypothetical protein XENTR_v10022582 [Xenopus tropicalis]|eukprot:XP_002937306.2 PREDICTED: uncharacterized protein LOC100498477 [Xenopus tropicalis]